MRTSRLTGGATAWCARQKFDLGADDLLDIAGADPGLHHRGRIDVEWMPGYVPPACRARKLGGISTANVSSPVFISGSIRARRSAAAA